MKNKFNIAESGNLFIFALIAMSLVSIITSLIPSSIYFGGISVVNWIGYGLTQIAVVLTIFIYSKLRKTNFLNAIVLTKKINAKQVLLTPFITISCLIAFLPLATCFSDLLYVMGYKGGVAIPTEPSAAPYIASIFIIALLPAFGEEFLLRGAILKGLNEKGVFFGVFISAFLFAFMHFNPMQTVYQFCLGAVLAVVAIYSGNIACTIIIHFLNNLTSLTISAFAPDFLSFDFGGYNYLIYLAMFIVGMLLLVLFMLLYYKASGFKNENSSVLEYDDYSFTFHSESEKKENFFVTYFKCLGGIFTKKGWTNFKSTLINSIDYDLTMENKTQTASVYIAIGFVSLWWLINLILGLI